MKLLLIKTSSMGDVIHTLPALSDAANAVPGLQVDWLVEPAFADIAALHPAVREVLPLPLRHLRRKPWRLTRRAIAARLGSGDWTMALDAQGLMKTALIARAVDCTVHGMNGDSAREPLAVNAYDVSHPVPRGLHAIERLRLLFAQALDYRRPVSPPDFGLRPPTPPEHAAGSPYVVFLHGTNWRSKQWSRDHWRRLAVLMKDAGYRTILPAHGAREETHARAIAAGAAPIEVLHRPDMRDMVATLAHAAGVVGVDTGLSHLAAAFGTPTVALFGPTSPVLTGLTGPRETALASAMTCSPCIRRSCPLVGTLGGVSPCMNTLLPDRAADALLELVRYAGNEDAHRLSAV